MAGCCTVLAVLILSWRPSHELLITALDVGQGDSIVIQTGQGEALLIDCGSSSKKTPAPAFEDWCSFHVSFTASVP